MIKAVPFKSKERFLSFQKKLAEYGVDYKVLNFDEDDWLEFDFSFIDILIYYPSFEYSSNHPLALQKVHDNIMFLNEAYPHIKIYPDPNIIKYYNDKYKQYLFLSANNYPVPETVTLSSEKSLYYLRKRLSAIPW